MTDRLSYVSGIAAVPLLYKTIGLALDEAAERWGDREALVVGHQDVRWSWTELATRAEALAAGFLALGLEPGDRVGIWSPNRAEWVLTQFATACAGLVLVNINPAYRSAELEYALNKVGCRALVLADRFKSSGYVQILRDLAPEIDGAAPGKLHAARLPRLTHAIVIAEEEPAGFHRFADIAEHATDESRHRLSELKGELQPEDPINIQFTSGTTGSPKGATLSHHNILNNGYFVGEAQGFTEQDRLCIPVPLYHCFGMVMGVLNCVTHGATMVFPGEAFEPRSVLETVEQERCTSLYGVPTMFIAELDYSEFGKFDLSSLRTGVMAGSPCPVEVMKKVIERMHMEDVTIAYGMTETSPVSFQTHPDDPFEKKVGCVGRIHPHLEVKIVDAAGKVVPVGERGELCTRGYSVMCGYWDDPTRTAESVDDRGWMHTGDLATIDESGYCNIVGRLKDMIVRGGENIYPREIEEYFYRHEKIQDVAVFGVPDDRYGEAVAAWILLKEGASATEQEVLDFCKGQIAHYKIPAYIRFVDNFPMTVTGKIQKFVMREQMAGELRLQQPLTA
ncbi:AMP-binding protein [Haliea sp. E1-2-M8]|uniref:AMP-binding protein n=1 Tax=Haliea sp. E1-2-M8 TaxID=3064706 RepID=UPI00271D4D33|nr:AMP-binding protein [Haliea sp. E1-2-M8]MDO8861306.1 AMP-binding protein [Haliea sp. E1-2-M8]